MSYCDIPDSKSGWLLKQSRGDVFLKNWRKRYIILEAGKLVYFVGCACHNGITTGADQKGELILENAKVFKGSGTGKFFQKKSTKQLYIVAGTDEHNLYLEASDAEDAEAWIQALEKHAQFATCHPSMVPQSKGRNSISQSAAVGSNSAPADAFTKRNKHDDTTPEDLRFRNDVLKTSITPTVYGLLLKTRDESSNTTVFVSIVSHPLCHDTPVAPMFEEEDSESERGSGSDDGGAESPRTPPAASPAPLALALVNPRCWFFHREVDYSRRTATKLGLRHYCEPALVKDGDPYVVMQVLINLETFYALIQEIQLVRESQQVTLMELIVSPPAMEFIELQKMYLTISAALAESHQVSCHKYFSIVLVEEQEYQPFFVSPMEIIIGRNGKHNQISFFTTLDNIQRHSENFLPLAGVQLHIRGQGVVPPKTAKGEINVIINLHSHAVCDKVRDINLTRGAANNTIITASHLKESSQRDLNHTMEECAKAIFLWGEAVHHTGTTGQEYYTYDVTTNTTIIRLCKLDNFARQNHQTSNQREASSPSSFRNSTAAGPGTIDIITMYILQSLSRYFDVKVSGYTASMKDAENPQATLSPPKSNLCSRDNNTIKPVKIIKFSNKTRLASALFTKEKHISNDYDSFLDINDIDTCGDGFDERQSRMSVSNIYSQNSFCLSAEDILFTDVEFFSSKLKELTSKGSNILDTLEGELTSHIDEKTLELYSEVSNSYKCIAHIITAELPTAVFDYPRGVQQSKNVTQKPALLACGATTPAVMSTVHGGDTIHVFCIKKFSDSSSWLLINSGWIPSGSSKCPVIDASFRLPTELKLTSLSPPDGHEAIGAAGGPPKDIMVVVECLYEATQCKGKGAPFRRHFKPDLSKSELNPFLYDKSSDHFTAIPTMRLLRSRASVDHILLELKTLSLLDELPESNSLFKAEECLNEGLRAMANNWKQEENTSYKLFLTPTEEDVSATTSRFKCSV